MASEIFRVEPFNNQLEANEMVDYGLSAKKFRVVSFYNGIPQQGTNQQWLVNIFE